MDFMITTLLQSPSAEPLTLAEAKAHLMLDTGSEDALVQSLITIAREHLERVSGLCLISQKHRLYLDCLPADGMVQLARGPLVRVDAIRIYDGFGQATTLSLAGLVYDRGGPPARIVLPETALQPGRALNGIEVDVTTGFGETGVDVPGTLKRAMLLHIGQMYLVRGAIALSDQPAVLPDGYERLIAPFRLRRL